MHMRFYSLVAGALVVSMVLSPMLFVSTVYAQASPPPSFVTLQVSKLASLKDGEASLLSGAFKRGGDDAKKAMSEAIAKKEIRIESSPDIKSHLVDPNGKVLATGKDAIGEYLAKLAEERKKQPQKDDATADQCIIPRPGQAEGGSTITGDADGFKPSSTVDAAYEHTADEQTTKLIGALATKQDIATGLFGIGGVGPAPHWESPLNFKLRKEGGRTLQEEVNNTLSIKVEVPQGKTAKRFVRLPSATEADTFNGSTYKINKIDIKPGKYTVNKPGTDGVIFDENCDPKQGPVPSVGPNGDNPLGDFGEGNGDDFGGGGGGGGGDDGGGLGGLASLLPALMQLLGQQRQQNQPQQQQQAQNPYTADCSQLGVSPVCGIDGKSYTNSCYAQQLGVPVAGTGPCVSPTPTPTLTPDVNAITAQLSQSGVPASLISTIRDAIVSALTAALGVSSRETVVQ